MKNPKGFQLLLNFKTFTAIIVIMSCRFSGTASVQILQPASRTTSAAELPRPRQAAFGSIYGVLQNSETRNCLRSTSENHVLAGECTGGEFENWDRFTDGRIKNGETRKCLDGDEDGHVFTASCSGKDGQRWIQDGAKRFVNIATKRCLSSNVVGYVHTGLCNDGVYKRWERHI